MNDPLRVFISYAHESDDFRESIRKLAIWLNKQGKFKLKVTTDHIHSNRPPKQGWQSWMEDQIEESDIVLIICTPKYLRRFRKKEEPGIGKGVAFEGAIITQGIYDDSMQNEKFHPLIPDDGDIKNVPVIFKPFFNHLTFPKLNDRILKLILNENDTIEEVDTLVDDLCIKKEAVAILENQIVSEIIEKKETKKVMNSIHEMVRSFLSLTDIQKITIAKKLKIWSTELNKLIPADRDKEIFKTIKEKNIIDKIWDEINNIKPFKHNINPFK